MSSTPALCSLLLPRLKPRCSPKFFRHLVTLVKSPGKPFRSPGGQRVLTLQPLSWRYICTEVCEGTNQLPLHPPPAIDGRVQRRDAISTPALKPACDEHGTASEEHSNTSGEKKPFSVRARRAQYNCSGCGAVLQSRNPKQRGFIEEKKLEEWLELSKDPMKSLVESAEDLEKLNQQVVRGVKGEEDEDCDDVEEYFPDSIDKSEIEKHDFSSFVCKRCFSLQHYNDALNITLDSQDYLRHLSSLRDKKSLLILMLDVADFPSCVFPNLKDLISEESSVLIVANKIDLFPRNLGSSFWGKFREHIITECRERSLGEHKIVGVRFASVKQGMGIMELGQEIVRKWGGQGDIYLLGCTNVGKSSLFNKLLFHLCGSRPGELNIDSNLLAPCATISQWPGTTLGLLSFPLISLGKRRRLLEQQQKREQQIALGNMRFEDVDEECDDFKRSVHRFDEDPRETELKGMDHFSEVEVEKVLDELGLRRKKKRIAPMEEAPQNRFWLHDTPGAINEAQLINYLTPKELTLGLPKGPLRPKTFILKPGQSLFLGGLARLDYCRGDVSAYFTVFSWSYMTLHTTKSENADDLYQRHLGSADSIFKLPLGFEERNGAVLFPPLDSQSVSVAGTGWKQSAADVVLSSVGWVAVTVGEDEEIFLKAHTPKGKGIYIRTPSLFDQAVNERGRRERYGNRTAYHGNTKKSSSRNKHWSRRTRTLSS